MPSLSLMAFADPMTLARLRKAQDLHRDDVHLRVVTDGDHFDTAWGKHPSCGSLMSIEWRETAGAEAFYTEATWAGPVQNRDVQCTRRKAVRLWTSGGLLAGAAASEQRI